MEAAVEEDLAEAEVDLVVTEEAEAVEALTEVAVEETVDNPISTPGPEIGLVPTHHAATTTSHGGPPATSATQNDRKVQEVMLEDLEVAEAEVVVDLEETAEVAVTAASGVTAEEVAIADSEAIVAADSVVIAVETVVGTAVMAVALEVAPCAADEEAVAIVTDLIKSPDTVKFKLLKYDCSNEEKKPNLVLTNVKSEDSAFPLTSQRRLQEITPP